MTILFFIGILTALRMAWSLVAVLWKSYTPFYAFGENKQKDAYALITGASDGIGKEFAMELARKGFNLILMARTELKLNQVADIAKKSKVKVVVLPFDFSSNDLSTVSKTIEKYKISVLINNVGISHDIPTPFIDESEQLIERIVNVNVLSVLKITKIVLNGMKKSKNGIIVNLGSFSGLAPAPYLGVYGATKSFLKAWSLSLAYELKPFNIHVEHLNTYFVATAMAKVRKSTLTIPSAENYVRAAVNGMGKYSDRTPYIIHAIMYWILTNFVPTSTFVNQMGKLLYGMRVRALKKREHASKAQ